MGNPKGSNAGNHGKKGRSGRKSLYEEKARAKMLVEAWFDGVSVQELQEFRDEFLVKNESGKMVINLNSKKKMKLWQLYLLKAIMNPKGTQLSQMFDTLFPKKIEMQGNEDKPLFLPVEIVLPSKRE